MKTIDCIQGGGEWLQLHVGRITASRINDVMDFTKKGEPGAGRKSYMAEKIAETLTGELYQYGYVSKDMQRGTELEPDARFAYEAATRFPVDQVGFVLHMAMDRAGASPDGLVGDDGGVEIKVPKTETHLRWLLEDVVPEEHRNQMIFGMTCCERSWWDFMSYDPRLPKPLQNFIKRLEYDEEQAAVIDAAVKLFLDQVDWAVEQLQIKRGPFQLGRAPEQPADTRSLEEWLRDFSGESITP